ncbi:hypothetical protein SUGI_0731420 [Cryptomeria japonica]|nr:hypothetical protein SUGI_0731420 [Cryptomeria japonica]
MAVEEVSKRLKEWDEDKQKVVNLTAGYFNEQSNPITLNLLGSSTISSPSSSSSCGLQSIESELIEVYNLNSVGGIGLSSTTFAMKEISGFNSTEEDYKGLELKLDSSTSNALKSSRKDSSNYINDCINDNSVSEVESALRETDVKSSYQVL